MLFRKFILLVAAIWIVLVSACDTASDETGTPQTEPTSTVIYSPTPNGGNVELEVRDFQIWQDFMPGLREGGPPLHATVLLRADSLSDRRPGLEVGTITISRPGGETVVKSPVTLIEALTVSEAGAQGQLDLQLAMAASPVSIQLTENEPLVGKLELTLDGSNVSLDLPATPLMFTH